MEDWQGRSPSLGQGLLLFLATRPPRLPPAAFASFWLSRSTDSEKITLPWQETTPLATRDGQIWRVVWSRIWLGLPAALPPCSLTSSLSGKAPCMRAREGISAPPSCERASPATGPSHRHSPTRPDSTRNSSRWCRRDCPLPAQAFPRQKGGDADTRLLAQRSASCSAPLPKASSPPGEASSPSGTGLSVPALRPGPPAEQKES